MENGNMDIRNGSDKESGPHIAVLPSPGMGHVVPLAELAKRLAAVHGFAATFLTYASSDSKAQRSYLDSLKSSSPAITALSLPAVSLSDLPPGAAIETLLSVEAERSVTAIAAILKELKDTTNLVAFVADLFGADTLRAAREAGVAGYLFVPSNLLILSLMLHLPDLDKTISGEFCKLAEPVKLPGCVPIPGADILQPLQDRQSDAYKWMAHHGEKYRDADGILVNTFDAIEPEAAAALRSSGGRWPPVYPVGPLIRAATDSDDAAGCIEWLDAQPAGSVLFVSFGSGGALPAVQMSELALGLELSGCRFLWVARAPADSEADPGANYYHSQSKSDPLGFLPRGFVERTGKVGLVVSSWAPQVSVLGHHATGGFLTHCGWNSVLESVANGVPMMAWPLYAEQRQNTVMLVEGLRVALRPPKRAELTERLIPREEIAATINELMHGQEGKHARAKVAALRDAAEKTLAPGGASYEALGRVAGKWKGSA